jgi:hypothetical protein
MKNPSFFALCFLTLAYCAWFVIIALVLVVARSIPKSSPTHGINAQNLAPIFEPVGSIDGAITEINRTIKKPKATLASLIREEATRRAS